MGENMFDVSGLVPEAREIAQAVAAIYWKHTRPWFVGLASFGSAVRGDVIPGSRIEFQSLEQRIELNNRHDTGVSLTLFKTVK